MRNPFRLALLGWVLVVPLTYAQSIVEVTYASEPVRLLVPKGYCPISRTDPLGALHYELQEKGNSGRNAVALLFSDCAEWAKRKADHGYILQRHGNYLFQLTNGREALLPAGTTRADVIKIYTDYESKQRGGQAARIQQDLQQKLASVEFAPNFKGPMNIGMIDRDANAVFFGVGATIEYPTGTARFIGVTAGTTTRRIPVTLNLYGPIPAGKGPFTELLQQQKALIRSLIAANE